MGLSAKKIRLTELQKLIWFDWKKDEHSLKYNNTFYFKLKGKVNKHVLQQSLQHLTNKHYALRTSFNEKSGEPYQIISDTCNTYLENINSDSISDDSLIKLLDEHLLRPFNYSDFPLFRYLLITIPKDQYALGFCWHHIITDGISIEYLFKEFCDMYNDLISEQQKNVIDTAMSIDEILSREDEYKKIRMIEDLNYWEKTLNYEKSLTTIKYPILQVENAYFRKRIRYKLPIIFTRRIREFLKRQECSLFILLLSAYTLALYFITRKDDFTIGYSVNTRTESNESLVGYHVNLVPFRVLINEDDTLMDYITFVINQRKTDKKHQYLPSSLLLKKVRQNYRIDRLFDVAINQFTYLSYRLNLNNITSIPLQPHDNFPIFDLTFLFDIIDTVEFEFTYEKDKYDKTFIFNLIEDICYFLDVFIKIPNFTVKNLLPPSHKRLKTIMEKNNKSFMPYLKSTCVHTLFEKIAENNEDHIALIYNNESVTYKVLNEKANNLAHYLLSIFNFNKQLNKINTIAIYFHSGINSVIAMLATIKAGFSYLPLSDEYPIDRINNMLNHSSACAILTQENISYRLKLVNQAFKSRIINIDNIDISNGLNKMPSYNIGFENNSNDIMYIIYTSGTTGIPKGIPISHNAVLCRSTTLNFINIKSTDRVIQVSNHAFDASVFEIWATLTNGATLVIIDKTVLLSPDRFYHAIVTLKPTICFMTTALLHQYIDYEKDLFKYFRIVLFGGEKVNNKKIYLLNKLLQRTKLINVYGPTETTIFASYCDFTNRINLDKYAPIGKPLCNTSLYVLDEQIRFCPIGVVGELYIGGEGVTRGYLNDQELTKAKFINNPFYTGKEGYDNKRLYKTGDLTYLLPDGNIEYVGRIDHQVKIRGLRIELHEVEHRLNKLPDIKQAIVDVYICADNRHLVAYVIPVTSHKTDDEKQKAIYNWSTELGKTLPAYMIPSEFYLVKHFLLTSSGKVSRDKLPKKGGIRIIHHYVPPRNDLERQLSNIWNKTLARDKVSIYDDFFEIGGDSLLVIKASALAYEEGIDLSPEDIFSHRSIINIARNISLLTKPLENDHPSGEALLLPIQNFNFMWLNSNPHQFNSSFLFALSEELDVELIKKTLFHIVEQHDSFRLRFCQDNVGNWKQFHQADVSVYNIPVYIISAENISLDNQLNYFREKIIPYQKRLNITDGPIMQCIYCEGRQNYLSIIIHHLIFDGLSLTIFLKDFQTIYESLKTGKPVEPPMKTHSYQVWGKQLYDYANDGSLKTHLDYWINIKRATSFPWDTDKKANQNNMSMKYVQIYDIISDETNTFVQNMTKNQLRIILVATLLLTNKTLYSQNHLHMHVVNNGRNAIFKAINVSRTIGCFITHTPITLSLTQDKFDLNNTNCILNMLMSVENQLDNIPDDGLSHGALRWYSTNKKIRSALKQDDKVRILFNFIGDVSDIFHEIELFTLPEDRNFFILNNINPRNSIDHYLGFHVFINQGLVELYVTYSSKHYFEETIQKIINEFRVIFSNIFAAPSKAQL